ncbi:MAG: hypothetical protein GY851_05590 [bacterium]|nr:hypothetical protein [bacterium]
MNLSARIAAVEFHGDEVCVASVKTGGRRPVVTELHHAEAVYSEPEQRLDALVEATRQAVDALKTKPGAFVLSLPGEQAVVRSMRIPFRGARRVGPAVPFELEPYLAIPIEDLVIDFTTIREVEGQTEVLALGFLRSVLEDQLGVLREAGVEPEGASVDAAGLTALWHANGKLPAGLHAALHVRHTGSIVTVTYNRSLAFLRHIELDPSLVREAEGVREVQNTLHAFAATWEGDETIQSLTVTGVDLGESSLGRLEDALGIPVSALDLTGGLKGGGLVAAEPATRDRPNFWSGPVGVAAAAAGGPFSLQFLKDDLATANVTRSLGVHLVFSACLALVVAAGYGAFCYLDHRSNVAQTERIGAEVWRLFKDAFPQSPEVQGGRPKDPSGSTTLAWMENTVAEAAQRGDLLPVQVLRRHSLLSMIEELNRHMPGDKVVITDLKIWPSEDETQLINITGEMREEAAFESVVRALRRSPLFTFDEEPVKTFKEGRAEFRLKGYTRPRGEKLEEAAQGAAQEAADTASADTREAK